jgi:hypothetical protein
MNLAPEFRPFCLALRRPLGPHDAAALRDAIAAAPDWSAIVAGARRHRVAPLVLEGLQSSGSTLIPEPTLAALRRQTVAVAQRSLAQAAEAGRLARAFAQAGVRMLVLKGVVLSAQLHDDSIPRATRDIDLLADPDRFAAAQAVLDAAGYRLVAQARTPRQSAAYRRAMKDLQFIHAGTGAPAADGAGVVSILYALEHRRELSGRWEWMWRAASSTSCSPASCSPACPAPRPGRSACWSASTSSSAAPR